MSRQVPRWRRIARWLLPVLVLPGVIVVVGYVWETRASNRDLERAIARLDRELPGWRFEDVEAARVKVPDEENAALVVLAAHSLMNQVDFNKPGHTAVAETPPHRMLRPEDIAALELELAPLEPGLAEARRLMNFRTGRYQVAWSKNFISMLVPHVPKAREVGNLLQADAARFSQQGKPEAAWHSSRAILGAGRSIGDEPLLISGLVRMALNNMAIDSLERTLGQGQVSTESLKDMQMQLLEECKQPLYKPGLRGELGGMHDMFGELENGNLDLQSKKGGTRPRAWYETLTSPLERIAIRRAHPWFLNHYADMMPIFDLPPWEQQAKLAPLDAKVATEAPALAQLLIAAVSKVVVIGHRHQARCQCAAAGLAAERYRLQHGRWPESLRDLVAGNLLPEVPLDPFDGQSLRFRRTKDGVVVYTIGPDGKGNGGGLDIEPFDPEQQRHEFRLWDVPSRRQPPLSPRPKIVEPDGNDDQ